MSEANDARESTSLDPKERIKVIGRFRPLEPGAEAAPWIVNGCTLTVPGMRSTSEAWAAPFTCELDAVFDHERCAASG